nr:RNA-directed DNA polymerase, eukaryota, reverse transcriptase zinc-binding domain protein [Tanacetum cinerariifolium]
MVGLLTNRVALDEYMRVWFRSKGFEAMKVCSMGISFHTKLQEKIASRLHVIEHLEKVGATSGWLMRLNRDQEDDVLLLGFLDTFVHITLYNWYILFNGIFIREDVLACSSNNDVLGYQRRDPLDIHPSISIPTKKIWWWPILKKLCNSGSTSGLGLIRLLNVPFEAWNVNGIRAIFSRLERQIKMDQMTAEMCKVGSGRLGFARVLVEINDEKPFLDSVEINCLRDSYGMLQTLQKAKLELLGI